jgi:hypothetical protein
MIKRIIQLFSVLILAAAFTAAPAQAQNSSRIDANIPFDFNIGNKSYPAGDYVIKISKSATDVTQFLLEDKEGKRLDNVLLSENGDTPRGESRLIFENRDNQHFLSKVLLDDRGFSLLRTGNKKEAVSKKEPSAAAKAAGTL